MVPGQQAGTGKAAAGFRIPRPSAGLFGEGEHRTGFWGIVLGTGGAASGSRDPRLVGRGGYLVVAMESSGEDWRREAAERPNWAGLYMASMRDWGAMTLPAATTRARYWHWKLPAVAQ